MDPPPADRHHADGGAASADSLATGTPTPAHPWTVSEREATVGDRPSGRPPPANIADPYADLLALLDEPLDEPRRRGMVALLAVGSYDVGRPSRAEVADLVSAAATGRARRPSDLDRMHRPTGVDRLPDPADPAPGSSWLERYSPVSF